MDCTRRPSQEPKAVRRNRVPATRKSARLASIGKRIYDAAKQTTTADAPSVDECPAKRRKANNVIPQPVPVKQKTAVQKPLTRKNLKLLDKMGKKGSKSESTQQSILDAASEASGSKATSTTSGFALVAYRNGILPPVFSEAPANLEEIRHRYNQPRDTASPTLSMYEHYVEGVAMAPNEETMVQHGSQHLLKKYWKEGYSQAYNQPFTGFPKEVGFNNGLSPAQPDFVQGLTIPQYTPFEVESELSSGVLHKDSLVSLSLPHIAGEWKGPGKNMELAKVQSSYDGAALVYSRNEALSYMAKSDAEDQAAVSTFTTDRTNLNMFAHYAKAENGKTKYHQYPVASANLVESHESFKKGYRTIRNAQDHARDQSRSLRDDLKEHWLNSQRQQERVRANYAEALDAVPKEPEDAEEPTDTTVVGAETGGHGTIDDGSEHKKKQAAKESGKSKSGKRKRSSPPAHSPGKGRRRK